jgi:hypothetical protein
VTERLNLLDFGTVSRGIAPLVFIFARFRKKIEIQVYWVSAYLPMKFQGKRVPIYGRTHEMIFFLNLLGHDSRIDGKGKLAKDRHPITPSPTVISKLALIVAAEQNTTGHSSQQIIGTSTLQSLLGFI